MNTTKQWPKRALILSRALSRAFSDTTSSSSTTFTLKHVTRSNFDSALSELRSHVRAADFVAIDMEMTGVISAPWRESFEFDRFDIRYLKVKDSAEKFAVVQFGVCPFRWDSIKQSFIAHPHNFFLFPRQEISLDKTSSYEFLCQTSSMDFLAKYQFDFNACINEGVSYLSRGQEDEARKRLKSLNEDRLMNLSHDLRETTDLPLVRVADVLFTERMKKRLSEWRDQLLQNRTGGHQNQGTPNDLNQQFRTVFFKMRPAVSLNGFTSHQLSLIRMVTRKHFKDLAYVRFNGESTSEFVVYTDSESDKARLVEEVMSDHKRRAEMKINDAVGFRHVIDLLSSENKLIVGHNCILDIAHVHSKFLGPLPSTAEEFVSCVNKYFPNIIDTKILLNADYILLRKMKKASTSLSSAFSLLCPEIAHGFKRNDLSYEPCVKVEVHVDEMRSSNWNSGAKHEAGFDAFMTGCVFSQACSHLGVDFQLHPASENLTQNEKLQKHMNLLYLSWINGDIIDLRTGNQTAELLGTNFRKRFPQILFKNIVLLWGFPSQGKPSMIRDSICKTLGSTSVISIYSIDQTAVFVLFSKAELVLDFLTLKETLERSNDAISVLHPLSQLLEGGNTRAACYETYKEICASPISKVLFADQAEAVGIKWKTELLPSDKEESEENNHSHPESVMDNPEAVERSKVRNTEDVAIHSSNTKLCDDIIDSFLKIEKIRRTTNL